ncbi:MAG: hypothetical protein SP1CHLAM54_07160 [Chlamydiia bacterium]|nr:hypothetical protein [Chlamydiia bacterium]MCH9615622.1 hypothetical protein [Chlamydiia bacterium]MCH9628975.1 hypothetical protein [Chlamydiia bacterium]
MLWKRQKDTLNGPLHEAVLKNDIEACKALVKRSRDKNSLGLNPQDLALFLGRKECLSLFQKPQTELIKLRKKSGLVELEPREFKKTFNVSYLPSLRFESYETLTKAIERCRKVLKKGALKTQNHWTRALHEKAFYKRPFENYMIAWVDPLIGYGVFASKTIPALTYVGEYTGLVRRRRRRKDRFNNYIFGYVAGPKETQFIIDAQYEGNFTRFINHSDTPNLTSKWMEIDGVCHIILFANRAIPEGEQLTYDYGEYYWRSRSYPRPI